MLLSLTLPLLIVYTIWGTEGSKKCQACLGAGMVQGQRSTEYSGHMWGKILLETVAYTCYAAVFVSGKYVEEHMRETVIVSSRGQITLPAKVRKRLGITPGSVVL